MNPPSTNRQPQALHRLLVRGVNWLGDAVMTTPALMRLRERFPDAHISILTPEKLKDLWMQHPGANEIITFLPQESLFAVSRKLRAGHFEVALILPNSPRSALESWMARIPQRIGRQRPWRKALLTTKVSPRTGAAKMRKRPLSEIRRLIGERERGASSSLRATNPGPSPAHQIHEYLQLAAALGANPEALPPKLFVASDEMLTVSRTFDLSPDTAAAGWFFGLNAGAEYGPAKRWPIERFIAAAQQIQERTHCTWLIFGATQDAPVAATIESALQNQKSKVRNLAGRTSLRELMALLKLCRVVLTNDTGPMHVAAALDTPVVVPFGSTSPLLTGPGLPGDDHHRVLVADAPCSPCFLRECPIDFRCMHGISVAGVVEAVLQAAAEK